MEFSRISYWINYLLLQPYCNCKLYEIKYIDCYSNISWWNLRWREIRGSSKAHSKFFHLPSGVAIKIKIKPSSLLLSPRSLHEHELQRGFGNKMRNPERRRIFQIKWLRRAVKRQFFTCPRSECAVMWSKSRRAAKLAPARPDTWAFWHAGNAIIRYRDKVLSRHTHKTRPWFIGATKCINLLSRSNAHGGVFHQHILMRNS